MYFLNGDNQLVIQGEGYFDPNASYPLGVITDAEGKATFNLTKLKILMQNNIFISMINLLILTMILPLPI
jgi:hypothetical protein